MTEPKPPSSPADRPPPPRARESLAVHALGVFGLLCMAAQAVYTVQQGCAGPPVTRPASPAVSSPAPGAVVPAPARPPIASLPPRSVVAAPGPASALPPALAAGAGALLPAGSGVSTAEPAATLRTPRLGVPRRLTVQADVTLAGWSSAGHLLLTGRNHRDLFLLRADGTRVRIAEGPLAGYKPEFGADGTTVFTRCNDPECSAADRVQNPYTGDHVHAHGLLAGEVDVSAATREREERGYVFQRDDDIFFARQGALLRVAAGGDRYFAPVLSPDRRRVAFEGLLRGIFVADVDGGNRVALGPGNNPAWSPDGSEVLFDRTSDDGSALTAGEILHAFVRPDRAEPPVALTNDPSTVRQRPAWSPDGRSVAYEEDGDIYVAPVQR
ncbi:MAG: PD40 domain-containing protein [Planctomycetes bacterium]|nr:PD40 domain-containing protein [Planctomycetota bacterium]